MIKSQISFIDNQNQFFGLAFSKYFNILQILARIKKFTLKQNFSILLFLLPPKSLISQLLTSLYPQKHDRQAKMSSKPNMLMFFKPEIEEVVKNLLKFSKNHRTII